LVLWRSWSQAREEKNSHEGLALYVLGDWGRRGGKKIDERGWRQRVESGIDEKEKKTRRGKAWLVSDQGRKEEKLRGGGSDG